MFHDTIRGQPALRPAGRHRRRAVAALSTRRRSATWCARCPTGWTPWSATAATGSPAGRSSGWRSPGCCSRPRRSSSWTRRPRTWTARARRRCRRALAEALAGRTSLVIAHRLSTIRDADTDAGGRRRPDRRARHARRAARRPAGCTPSCTAPSSSSRVRRCLPSPSCRPELSGPAPARARVGRSPGRRAASRRRARRHRATHRHPRVRRAAGRPGTQWW